MQTQADKAVKENQQITDKLARLQRELDDVQTHNATLKADNTGLTTSIRQQVQCIFFGCVIFCLSSDKLLTC